MKWTKRRVSVAVTALALTASMTACGGYERTTDADGLVQIRVGVLPTGDVLPIYLGEELGIFAEHGLSIQPVVAQGGAAILPAVVQGDVQIAFTNTISYMISIEKRLPLTVVTGSHLSHDPDVPVDEDHPVSALLVDPASGIETAADLEGRRVSINALGNIQEVAVRNAIEQGGGDPDEVDFLELPLSQASGSLAEGQVQAISVNEPFTTGGIDDGYEILARPFTDFEESAAQISVYFTTASFAEEYPDDVDAFRATYAREHPDEAREILQGYTGISDDVAERVTLPYYTARVNRASVEELAELSTRYGLLEDGLDWDAMFGDVPTLED
jgi:NitT/TauT family transport system substrate-binding protein